MFKKAKKDKKNQKSKKKIILLYNKKPHEIHENKKNH
jgi:hypothetical protein